MTFCGTELVDPFYNTGMGFCLRECIRDTDIAKD
jgi:hypothetical protein